MADTEQTERLTDLFVRILFFIWVILLVPWIVIAPLSGMAVDGGYTISAIGFILSMWTYPVAVFGAFKLLDRSRKAVLLPLVNLVGIPIFSSVLQWITRQLG
jgi:hypothetical protein